MLASGEQRHAPAPTRTPTCSGRSAAAAATSASSPRSCSACTRSDTVIAGPTFWPVEESAEVLSAYREFLPNAPRELNGFFAFTSVPPAPPFPEELHLRKVCGVVWCYVGTEEDARQGDGAAARRGARAADARRAADAAPGAAGRLRRALPDRATSGTGAPTSSTRSPTRRSRSTPGSAPRCRRCSRRCTCTRSTAPPTTWTRRDTAWSYRDANWGSVFAGVDPDPANVDAIRQLEHRLPRGAAPLLGRRRLREHDDGRGPGAGPGELPRQLRPARRGSRRPTTRTTSSGSTRTSSRRRRSAAAGERPPPLRGGGRSLRLPGPAPWRSGYAAACKAVYTGSTPVGALALSSGIPLGRAIFAASGSTAENRRKPQSKGGDGARTGARSEVCDSARRPEDAKRRRATPAALIVLTALGRVQLCDAGRTRRAARQCDLGMEPDGSVLCARRRMISGYPLRTHAAPFSSSAARSSPRTLSPGPYEVCSWCDYRLICPASEA